MTTRRGLPKRIQAQKEFTEALLQKTIDEVNGVVTPPAPALTLVPPTPQDPPDPSLAADAPPLDPGAALHQDDPLGLIPPTPAALPQPDDAATLKAELASWQQRYAVLNGKYLAEGPEQRARIQQLSDTVAALTDQLAELRRGGAAPLPTPQPGAPDPQDEADAQLLGPDAFEAIKRLVNQGANAVVAPIARHVGQDAFKAFQVEVEAQVPNWRELQNHPAWPDWVASDHPEAGVPRGYLLDRGIEARNSTTVIQNYNAFKAHIGMAIGPGAARGQPTPPPVPVPAAPPLMKPLDARTVPSGGGAASTPTPLQPKLFSKTDVHNFFKEKAEAVKRALTPTQRAEWDRREREMQASVEKYGMIAK